MKLFHKLIRAIERNSRANERRRLTTELNELLGFKDFAAPRIRQICTRLEMLGKEDSEAYLNRHKPVKSVAQMVEEDDCGVPEGLVGKWKAPVARPCAQGSGRIEA